MVQGVVQGRKLSVYGSDRYFSFFSLSFSSSLFRTLYLFFLPPLTPSDTVAVDRYSKFLFPLPPLFNHADGNTRHKLFPRFLAITYIISLLQPTFFLSFCRERGRERESVLMERGGRRREEGRGIDQRLRSPCNVNERNKNCSEFFPFYKTHHSLVISLHSVLSVQLFLFSSLPLPTLLCSHTHTHFLCNWK